MLLFINLIILSALLRLGSLGMFSIMNFQFLIINIKGLIATDTAMTTCVSDGRFKTRFIGCSNRANCMEISAPIVGDLLLLEQCGIVTYDALLGKQVKLLSVYSLMYRQFNTGKINCTCHDAHWRQSKSIRVPQPHGFNC